MTTTEKIIKIDAKEPSEKVKIDDEKDKTIINVLIKEKNVNIPVKYQYESPIYSYGHLGQGC